MTTFAVSTNTNWHSLTGRTGSDVYNLTNCTLTIDGDSRYGPNTTPTTGPMGTITFNGVQNSLVIDGRNVRLIPYSGGSGTVPAADTVISQGGVTGKLLGVWSAINTTPTAAGAAMPAAGFIKVRQKAGGNYAAGALTGITATSSGADIAGWIEIVGIDTAGVSNSALAIGMRVDYLGEWFELGITSGVRNQTMQGPASLTETRYPGVFIETAVGSNDFRFWPSAATVLNVAQDERGKHVWCDAQGGVRIGHNGTSDAGLLPAAGLRVVIGNVLLLNTNATAGLGANVTASTTANQRYNFNHTLLKTVMSKVMCGWRSGGSGYASEAYDTCFQDQWLLMSNKPFVYQRVGVGPTGARASVAYAAQVGTNLDADALCEDYSFCCIALAGASNRTFEFLGSYGGVYRRGRLTVLNPASTSRIGVGASASYEVVFDDIELVGCGMGVIERGYAYNVKYADKIFGTQDGTTPQTAVSMSNSSTLDGLNWLISTANTCHPVTRLIGYVDGCTVRNVGSPASPVPMGTVNPCLAGINVIGGGAGLRVDVRRVYTTAIGNGAATLPLNFGQDSRIYDISMDARACPSPNRNAVVSGYQTNGLRNPSATSNFGALVVDGFYSDTEGFIDLHPSEPAVTADSPSSLLSSGANFAGSSWVNLPTVGAWIEWTTNWVYGHTGFQNVTQFTRSNTGVSQAVPSSYCTLEYDIDKGSGFSGTMTALTGANMSAETGIDPAIGFRLKVRVTSTTVNVLTFYAQRIFTTTTSTERYRQHNLSDQIVIVNGLATGSRVKISRADTGAVLFSGLESSGSVRAVLGYVGDVQIEARKASSAPYYQPWVTLATLAMKSTTTLTAVQLRDDQ